MKWVVLALFFLLIGIVAAVDYPELRGFITDNADIIDDENRLKQLAGVIEQESTVEVAVVTVASLEGVDIESYAVELFERAGIGKEDIDNGLLILIAMEERKYRVEVGFGLEGVITDVDARIIGDRVMAPHFSKGDFEEGLFQGLTVIRGFVSDNEEVVSKFRSQYIPERRSGVISLIPILFIIIVIVSIVTTRLAYPKRSTGFFPVYMGGFGGGFRGGGFGGGFGGFGGGLSGGGGFSGSF
jgi:uncharacterized protein